MRKLAEKIGYQFKDMSLLETALTHSSYANESRQDGIECNERLEFLGDSVLGVVSAEHLFREFPSEPEGFLTKNRAILVCEQSLHKTAQALGLGEYIKLGRGEEKSGGRNRISILADAVEAIIAAIYLDGGFAPAKEFILKFILCHEAEEPEKDAKSELQEYLQKNGSVNIEYILTGEEGPDHNKAFSVSVSVNGKVMGSGEGRTKKAAEQMAAKMALEKIK